MDSICLERMDRHLAYPIAGVDLDGLAYQLDYWRFFLGSNRETRQNMGLASLPHSHSGRRHTINALDRAGVGRATAVESGKRANVRARGADLGRNVIHLVGANSSRTVLVERDHTQGRPSRH